VATSFECIFLSAKVVEAMTTMEGGSFELLYYKKSGQAVWLQEDVVPVKSGEHDDFIVLFLCTFRDITAFKAPLLLDQGGLGQAAMMSNLSRFAKLAWTMTRSRNLQLANRMQAGQQVKKTLRKASYGYRLFF